MLALPAVPDTMPAATTSWLSITFELQVVYCGQQVGAGSQHCSKPLVTCRRFNSMHAFPKRTPAQFVCIAGCGSSALLTCGSAGRLTSLPEQPVPRRLQTAWE